jgi:hypothetical protein
MFEAGSPSQLSCQIVLDTAHANMCQIVGGDMVILVQNAHACL